MLPLKHIHKKKLHLRNQIYSTSLFDKFMYVVACMGPIMTLPQIRDIWLNKQTSVNEVTWVSYLLISFVWLGYGVLHKEKPIIFSNTLGIITNSLVVLGATIYP